MAVFGVLQPLVNKLAALNTQHVKVTMGTNKLDSTITCQRTSVVVGYRRGINRIRRPQSTQQLTINHIVQETRGVNQTFSLVCFGRSHRFQKVPIDVKYLGQMRTVHSQIYRISFRSHLFLSLQNHNSAVVQILLAHPVSG